jgi:type I restriction enzyme, S subunit
MRRHIHGSTMQHIVKSAFNNIEIPLPPLPEQKRIAETLDKAQGLIDLRKKQIVEMDRLAQAVFIEMFGDPVRNEKGWEKRSITDFYDIMDSVKCGPFGSALKKDEYVDEGIPVWTMDNIGKNGEFYDDPKLWITKKKYKELNAYNAENGDIIISRAGTVGKMCVVQSSHKESIISTNLIRLRLSECLLPLYVVSLITYFGSKVARLRTGDDGAFTHMNTGVIDSIVFPYPEVPLQNQYLMKINQIEMNKMILKRGLLLLAQNYNILVQRCFH